MKRNLSVLLALAVSLVPTLWIATHASNDVLTKHLWLHQYVSLCEAALPGISRLSAISSFPEVARLVLSVAWTLVPIQLLVFAYTDMLRPDWDRIRQHRTLVTLGAAIAVFVVLAFAILFDIQPQDMDGWLAHERVLRRASASRFWLGASAGVALTGIAILLYTVLFLLGHFRTVYVCKKGVT